MLTAPDLGATCATVRDRASLSSVVSRAGVKLARAGKEWKARCPFHADRSPSFTIYASDRRFMCFGCGAEGDVLDFVRRAHDVSLREAIAMLDGGALPTIETPQPVEPAQDRGDEARAIWQAARPVDGTPAEAYLRRRGITMALPPCLAFSRLPYGVRGPLYPVLVTAICSPSGEVIGVQRTYLTEDGRKASLDKVKLSLGRVRGGAIQLAPPAAEIVITEGLEDGLTLAQELGRSVWVSAGTSMMPSMNFPPAVRSIVIGADGDDAGEMAAKKAAAAFVASGRTVRIMRPAAGFKDFNAELMGARV